MVYIIIVTQAQQPTQNRQRKNTLTDSAWLYSFAIHVNVLPKLILHPFTLYPHAAADTSDGQISTVVDRSAPRGGSSDAAAGLSPSGATQPSADSPSGKGGSSSRDSGCYASSEHLKKLSSRQHEGASPSGTPGPAKLVFVCCCLKKQKGKKRRSSICWLCCVPAMSLLLCVCLSHLLSPSLSLFSLFPPLLCPFCLSVLCVFLGRVCISSSSSAVHLPC